VRRTLATAAVIALAVLVACGDDDGAPAPMPAADAGPLCTEDPGESCTACYELIGTCCYDDSTIGGDVPTLVATCESEPTCLRCCSECAAMDCDMLRANHDCPNELP
jgi:hypothetical protein